MNDRLDTKENSDRLQPLKRLTTIVYLCQIFSFVLAGLPLLAGVIINFINRNDVEGTWLESHFNWQVQTVWMTLAGFALAGLTLETGIGFLILVPTVMLLVYRIVIGWNALNAGKPVNEKI